MCLYFSDHGKTGLPVLVPGSARFGWIHWAYPNDTPAVAGPSSWLALKPDIRLFGNLAASTILSAIHCSCFLPIFTLAKHILVA